MAQLPSSCSKVNFWCQYFHASLFLPLCGFRGSSGQSIQSILPSSTQFSDGISRQFELAALVVPRALTVIAIMTITTGQSTVYTINLVAYEHFQLSDPYCQLKPKTPTLKKITWRALMAIVFRKRFKFSHKKIVLLAMPSSTDCRQ